MQLSSFTLTICLFIYIHQIYEWFYFYLEMGSCDIYSQSKILRQVFVLLFRFLVSINYISCCFLLFRSFEEGLSVEFIYGS